MKPNIGTTDRGIRMIIGIAIVAIGLYFKSMWGLIGVVFLLTATVRICPAYLPFGFSTQKEKAKE